MVQAWDSPGPAGERDHEPSACLVGLTVWREMQTGKQAIADHRTEVTDLRIQLGESCS